MEVGTGADGIQRLLAAETEAQAIVSKARKGTRNEEESIENGREQRKEEWG